MGDIEDAQKVKLRCGFYARPCKIAHCLGQIIERRS